MSPEVFPIGARIYVDGHHIAHIRQAFPEGSTSLLSAHYVVDFAGGDKGVKVAMTRVGVVKREDESRR